MQEVEEKLEPETQAKTMENELCYFNADENMYKIFDPETKTWSS